MDRMMPLIVSGLGSIMLLAIIATLVSKQAQTGQVVRDFGSAFSSIIGAAVAPVSNAGTNTFGTAPTVGT
jgi:hypothetical protein